VNEQARSAWAKARHRFALVLRDRHEGDALEELGWAGWWLGDGSLALRARERAFRHCREASDSAGAGRAATWLALDHFEFRGDAVAAHTWLDHAHMALAELPESPDHAWLMLVHADIAQRLDRDVSTALALARSASNLGRAFRIADVEAIGLGLEGLALVGLGAVADAAPALDTAAAIVASEPMQLPFAGVWTLECCVRALEGTGDLARATNWCDAARVATARSGLRHFAGRVRTTNAGLAMLAGDWKGAERELVHALRDLRRTRPGLTAPTYARLGELRARQGREQEARALLERSGVHGLIGSGRLALASDDTASATACAERFLDNLPEDARIDRLPALELLARARLRTGDLLAAEPDTAAVVRIAESCGTPFARGLAELLSAELAAGRGEPGAAREAAGQAIREFDAAHAPYHAAQAHVALAASLAALGYAGAAERERAAAQDAFHALGALADLERLRLPPPLALAGLTARESQILRLIADGRTDADVARHLALSPSTVQRNVVSLRAKLRLPSRAAASAYAARAGLT
jgi:DNA-binding CsgD family transcriptional regulator